MHIHTVPAIEIEHWKFTRSRSPFKFLLVTVACLLNYIPEISGKSAERLRDEPDSCKVC